MTGERQWTEDRTRLKKDMALERKQCQMLISTYARRKVRAMETADKLSFLSKRLPVSIGQWFEELSEDQREYAKVCEKKTEEQKKIVESLDSTSTEDKSVKVGGKWKKDKNG